METWHNRVLYLSKVRGEQIVEKQDQINESSEMRVKATQIFPLWRIHAELGSVPNLNDDFEQLYDAFIYYDIKEVEGSTAEADMKINMKQIGNIKIPSDIGG